jgi:transposase
MPTSYARLLDPTLEDDDHPFAGYDARREPLEDRLYLPCGVDPHGDICGVCFVHPYPQRKEVLCQRIVRNNNLQDMLWMIETGDRLAAQFAATPIYVFETTNVFWRAQRNFLHRASYATATVCGRQTKHARDTVTRKTKKDLKDAYNITKIFKQGESHATRILPEPLASLREYCRLHQFLTSYSVAIQNRMYTIRYQIHPEFDDHFSKRTCPTTLALMEAELVHPLNLLPCDLDDLTQLIRRASHGKLGRERAEELQQSALLTFPPPYAAAGLSFSLKLLAQAYQHLHTHLLPPLLERITGILDADDFPIEHHLDEIKYFGPLVIGTFLSELGLPSWFPTVDSVVAWFGLDPAVSESANKPTGSTHLTKRGTKYGRRMMWLVGRNWSRYVKQGRQLFLKERQQNKRSYDAAVCVVAAKLVRIAFAMVRDGSHFDVDKAF